MTMFIADPDTFNYSYLKNNQINYYVSDPRRSVQKATAWTVALNWFWTQRFNIKTQFSQTLFKGGCSSGAYLDPVAPGCTTASEEYYKAVDSYVTNRPNEYVFMESFSFYF
jgi:hypothetical protein